jgi:hypothetical protein
VRIVPLGEKCNAAAFRPTRPLHEGLAALQEIRLEDHCWKGAMLHRGCEKPTAP